ncbi:MAG TPA: hypothetical protein VF710_22390 [Longimicrobium sp.]
MSLFRLRYAAAATAVALTVACSGRLAAPARDPAAWRVGTRSFGPISYGSTVAEATRSAGRPLEAVREYKRQCGIYRFDTLPAGVSIMVSEGRVVRVEVDGPSGIRTTEGAGVGSTEDEIRRLYPGRIRTDPHAFADGGAHYLVLTPEVPSDTTYGLVFETNGTAVVSYRAGLWGAALANEGCL